MKNTARKLFALLLCLVMVAGLFPAAALAEEGESASAEAVRVEFVCDPPETIVTVYDPADLDENGQMAVIEPEEDGSYLLLPGTYLYDAECEGYICVESQALILNEYTTDVRVHKQCVTLEPLPDLRFEISPQGDTSETYLWPVPSCTSITNGRGWSSSHNGIDIPGAKGANIVATKSGTVVAVMSGCSNYSGLSSGTCQSKNICSPQVLSNNSEFVRQASVYFSGGCNWGFGNGVIIKHSDGTHSQYAHMTDVNVTLGQQVSRGAVIGHVGASGNADGAHLHFTLSSSIWPSGNFNNNPSVINYDYSGSTPSTPTEITFSDVCVKSGSASGSAVTSVAKDQAILYGKLTYGNDNKPDYFNLYLGTKQNQLTKLQINDNSFSDTTLSNNYPNCAFWVSFKDGSTDIDTNPLVAGTTYYYQFEAVSRSGTSYFSEVKSFKTTGTAPTYTIHYSANGGTGAPAAQAKTYGVDLTLSSTKPTRASASAGSYTVTLNANGGSVSTTSLTAARTTSYSFKNWNTAANGSGDSYAPGATYAKDELTPQDVTLYAQWNSSTSTAAVTLPTPTRDDYVFKGWATSSTATSGVTGSYTPTGNVTLYAVWEAVYKLDVNGRLDNVNQTHTSGYGTFDVYINGTRVAASVTDYCTAWPVGTSYEIKNITATAGHVYSGVYSGSLSGTIQAKRTVTLAFHTQYTITYNANGGTGAPEAQTKTHDVALTLSSTKPTRSNASAGSYTVTLNANGGSVSTTSLTAARTTSYSFKNWNTKADGSGTSYASGGSYTANAAATLYAQWNSSTATAAVTLPTPTRTGYSFKGWATSASATSGTTGSYTPTGNVTLYAIWQANPYTITFDANGGTGAPAAQTKLHDVALTLSTTKPTRANASAGSYTVTLNANGGSVDTTSLTAAGTTSYTFNNWNTKADGSGTSYASGGSYTANAAATLYAQWNSSTSTAAVTLPTPTREGFTFKGWATSDTATEGTIGSYTPTGNVTLYAIWEQNAPETNAKLVVDGGRVRVGQEIQVPVRIEENPGVVSIEISVLYDETVLEWTAVTPGEYGGTFLGEVGDSLTWYAEDPRTDETKDGVFATLTFRVKEGAAAGTTQVSVSYEEDDIYNADEENQAFQTVPGEIVIYTYIPGDINGDGSVNNKDVLRLQKYLKGQNVEVVEAALDVNGDGKVNNKDATRLARWLKYHDVEIH